VPSRRTPSSLIDPPHLCQNKSRPGDIYAIGNGLHMKDSAIDTLITSTLQRSGLSQSSKLSDHAIKKAENEKFRKDAKSTGLIQLSATKRIIPLAMNRFSLRGGHFNATLKEFASPSPSSQRLLPHEGSLRLLLERRPQEDH